MSKTLVIIALGVVLVPVAAGARPLAVRSSLDRARVLPHRIHWLAYPSVPARKVRAVEFRVDGRLVWVEHHPPYTYGLDGNWLVTSWLAHGLHRFSVRVVTTDGRRATDTVVARTLTPPQPPAPLVGTWHRTVTQAKAGSGTPAGRWTLTIDASGWRVLDPLGGLNWVDVAYLGDDRLQARGGIWTSPIHASGGNGWCEDTNTPVDYSWAVTGATLTVTLVGRDGCGEENGKQHYIWAGDWTRAG
jgi:hypothetical protein